MEPEQLQVLMRQQSQGLAVVAEELTIHQLLQVEQVEQVVAETQEEHLEILVIMEKREQLTQVEVEEQEPHQVQHLMVEQEVQEW